MKTGENGQQIKVSDFFKLIVFYERTLKSFGLRPHQYGALQLLKDNPGFKPGELARELSILPAFMSRIIKYLSKAELIRIEFGYDRRTRRMYLTEKGRALLDRIDEQVLNL